MSNGTEFLVSYENLLKLADLKPDRLPKVIQLDRDVFINIIKNLLRAAHVDEDWYRNQNADVDAAIAAGMYRNGKQHFVEDGYFEGRRSGPVIVDEEWYRESYPDVAEGIDLGEIASAQEHFDTYGYREGRLPAPS